jgi:hypothetical protein
MTKLLKSNSNYETYYYPVKQNNFKKWGIIIFVLFVIVTVLVYFFQKDSEIKFQFNDITSFKQSKERHLDYFNQIAAFEGDVLIKNSQRKTVDSLYLVKNIELLRNKRTEIFNESFNYSSKLKDIQIYIDDYNRNRLIIESPINLLNQQEEELKNYEIDMNYYQFEVVWEKRNKELDKRVRNEISKEAISFKSKLTGSKTEVISEKIQIIDSTIVQINNDVREIIYEYDVDRVYEGFFGKKYRYFGNCKWQVVLNKNNKNFLQINRVENNLREESIN